MLTQNSLTQNLVRFSLISLVSLVLFSCTDSGCIDADDFGEYESQTIIVTANAGQDACSYNAALSIIDSTQGSGIKSCLTRGTTTATNGNGVSESSTTGCYGLSSGEFQTICISGCVQTCLSAVGSASSAGAEPAWNSTDKKGAGQNSGVTIKPGSQIIVRAVGSISLGRSIDYPSLYLMANNPRSHSYNSSWQNNFFDVRSGQSLGINFSGLVYQGGNGTTLPLGQTADVAAHPEYLNNLARKLVVYTIPHPENYGGFDINKTTEKEGSITVPLWPDPQAWQCSYSGTSLLESTCGNASYRGIGYSNVVDKAADSTFPITSALQSSILTQYGGVIRRNGDGLNTGTYDPFAVTANNVICNGANGSCTNIANVPVNQGQIIGDLSSASIDITNSNSDAFKVSFRSLTGDVGCGSSATPLMLSVSVLDSQSNPLYSYSSSVINTSWTNTVINLESGQKLRIATNATKHFGTGVNCGRVIGIRYLKYHDLIMQQSGFLRFATLGAPAQAGGTTCTIKGRIINPSGSHVDNGTYGADFYEYLSVDPMAAGLSVPFLVNGSTGSNWAPGIGASTTQVYVRKGQKIRFDPDSWNNTWTSSAGARQCGIGMTMTIDPRPALLCRGKTSEMMPNPSSDCIPDINSSGVLIGCQALATKDCSDESGASYCPVAACAETVTCSGNGVSPDYTKTSCALGTGAFSVDSCINLSSSKCTSCSNKKLANAKLPAMVSVTGIDQCYDLENYTGKAENIPPNPLTDPLSIENVNDFLNDPLKAKGAVKLNGFNGNYGNISSFSDTGTSSVDKKVYRANSQYFINSDSRLRLIVLDGNVMSNIWGSYSDNTSPTVSYNGNNGIKIGFSGGLEFKNGTWLQMQLCKESSNSNSSLSYDCKSVSTPTDFAASANQPELVNITLPSPSTPIGSSPSLTGNYAFDSSGNLYRINPGSVAGDCTLATQGLQNSAGSMFYCHTYEYYSEAGFAALTQNGRDSSTTNVEKLRLTFKILDPEIANCKLTTTGADDGIKLDNPYYSSSATNTGATCTSAEIPGSAACKKQFYCANKYSNNSGEYYVNVKVKSTHTGSVSSVISAVVKPIIEVMDGKQDDPATLDKNEATIGQSERIYKLLIADPRYQAILTVSLVVMITFWGVGYLLGVSELNHTEIITRVFKIGFIYLMVGVTGWEWFKMFFVAFFKEGTDYLSFMMASSFDESPELAAAIESGNLYDKSVLFSSVDNVFNLFFSPAVQKKVYALFFASIFGWAYCLIIMWSFVHYVYAVSNAILLYLTAQVFISIMFVVGPIFFVFMIFSQTKDMFDNWLKQLIGFSLQQIFLLITLAFFNMLMYEVIKMSLGYKVCWDEIWVMNLGITRISLMSFWTIASLPPRTNANSQVGNIGNPEGIPSIFTILFIWVIASLMEQFIGFMTEMAATISGGLKATEMGKGIAAMASKIKGATVDRALDYAKAQTVDRVLDYADDKLFDHGKAADGRRDDATKKDASDAANANSAIAAGKEAASKHRAETGDSSAAGSAAAAAKGQRDHLTKMGITDEKEIDKILNSKGAKTGGAKSVAGALYNAASNRGTINKSAAEQAADETGNLSEKEFSAALENATPKGREDLVKARNSGEKQVDRSAAGTAYDIMAGETKLSELVGKKVSSGLKQAGETLSTGVGVAIKTATGIDVGDVSNALGRDKDRNEAKDQLIKEGSITELMPGTEMSRNKEEKALLDERTAEIKKDKKPPTPAKAVTTGGSIAGQREAEHLNEMDKIDEADHGPLSKAIRKTGQQFSTAAKSLNPGSNSRKKFANEAAKNPDQATVTENQMIAEIEVGDKEIGELKVARADAMSVVKENKGSVDSKKSEIGKLRGEYQKHQSEARKGLLPSETKDSHSKAAASTLSKIKEKEKELYGSDEYKAHQSATVAVHQIDSKISSKEAKGDNMKGIFSNIENSRKAVVDEVKKAAGKGTEVQKQPRSSAHRILENKKDINEKDKKTLTNAGEIFDKMAHTKNETIEGSPEHTQAEEAFKAYQGAENQDDFDKFEKDYTISKQEIKADKMEKDFDKLKSPEDFAKFSKANPVKK